MKNSERAGNALNGGALVGLVMGGVLGLELGDMNLTVMALCAAIGMISLGGLAWLVVSLAPEKKEPKDESIHLLRAKTRLITMRNQQDAGKTGGETFEMARADLDDLWWRMDCGEREELDAMIERLGLSEFFTFFR